jgi:glutathione peroxidase-family protein
MPSKLTFFEKADVNGASAREVFSFLKHELPNEDGTLDLRWNFGTKFDSRARIRCSLYESIGANCKLLTLYAAKFLVDHEGVPYKRFSPKTPPFDLKGDIEALLKKKEAS